jgi:hypothetical protein
MDFGAILTAILNIFRRKPQATHAPAEDIVAQKWSINMPEQSKKWHGIVWHHSATKDSPGLNDWEAIRKYHTSWRHDGHIITSEEWHKRNKADRKGLFQKPWSDIGYHCLSGETRIPTLNGTKTLKDIVASFREKDIYVFSCDDFGRVVIGKVSDGAQTGEKEIVRVSLDNGMHVDCTPDHKILLLDGSWTEAGKLKSGDRVMPFYQKIKDGRRMVRHPKTGGFHFAYRIVAEQFLGFFRGLGKDVHHKNKNKRDDSPGNLEILSKKEHALIHSESIQKAKAARNRLGPDELRRLQGIGQKKRWKNPVERQALLDRRSEMYTKEHNKKVSEATRKAMKDPAIRARYLEGLSSRKISPEAEKARREKIGKSSCGRKMSSEARKKISLGVKRSWSNDEDKALRISRQKVDRKTGRFMKNDMENHKVVSVIPVGIIPVYDITVDDHHNFATEAGLFAHNCGVEREKGKLVFRLGRSWEKSGAHAGLRGNNNFNAGYLGFCCVGNFDEDVPDKETWDLCLKITREVMKRFDIKTENVIGHREVYKRAGVRPQKSCPGKKWDMEKFRKDL